MAGAIVNPAFVPLSKQFDITVVQASYELTVYIVFAGIGPLLTVPLANIYGRRPVYLAGNLVAAVTNIAAGYCTTWSGLIATRVRPRRGSDPSGALMIVRSLTPAGIQRYWCRIALCNRCSDNLRHVFLARAWLLHGC